MSELKNQTIRQYAKLSQLPLKELLNDLKEHGIECNADDVINSNFRKVLIQIYRKKYLSKKKIDRESKIKEKENKKLKTIFEQEKKAFKKEPDLIKLGKMLDLCIDLLPKTIQYHLFIATQNKTIKEIFIDYILKNHEILKKIDVSKLNRYNNEYDVKCYLTLNEKQEKLLEEKKLIILNFSRLGAQDELQKINNKIEKNYFDNFNKFKKIIQKKASNNLYCSAILEIFFYIITNNNLTKFRVRDFDFVSNLLLEMGAIDNLLKLYFIDPFFFVDPNKLSILAKNAVKANKLEESKNIVDKLIKKEPFHPAIADLKSEIKRLEQRNYLKSERIIDFSEINQLSGIEFENLLIDKFSQLGFTVNPTPKTGDFGADIIVENKEGTRIIVQCKRFKSKVNLKAVQEVVAAIGHYSGDMGVVITNNYFLNSAIKLAESYDIELWDGNKLLSFLCEDLSFSNIFN